MRRRLINFDGVSVYVFVVFSVLPWIASASISSKEAKKWALLVFTSFFPCLARFYWVLLGFTGFYWVLLGFTEFYWVLLGFTEFYLVLLGFTEFYLVLLGLT